MEFISQMSFQSNYIKCKASALSELNALKENAKNTKRLIAFGSVWDNMFWP